VALGLPVRRMNEGVFVSFELFMIIYGVLPLVSAGVGTAVE